MTAQQLLVQPQLATDRQPPLYSSAELGDSWYDALGKINTNFTTLFNASELIAGSGIVIAGDTISVDQTFSPTWTGSHTFVNQVIFGQTSQNYVTVNGSSPGSSVAVSAFGTDTSVSLSLTTKGANGGLLIDDAKANFWTMAGSATTFPVTLTASGADTNISIGIKAKGTGSVLLTSDGNTAFAASNASASAVNYLGAIGATTGNWPTLNAIGSDNNIGINLVTKGSGLVQFGTAGNFTANGAQAMSLGSTGPSAANTSPQEWLTIVDHGGTTRYIPCF